MLLIINIAIHNKHNNTTNIDSDIVAKPVHGARRAPPGAQDSSKGRNK